MDPEWAHAQDKAEKYAYDKVQRDFDQGWQGIEYKLNTVGSSRGDYPFVTVTLGLGTERFEKLMVALKVDIKDVLSQNRALS